jgi:hypothetical protein
LQGSSTAHFVSQPDQMKPKRRAGFNPVGSLIDAHGAFSWQFIFRPWFSFIVPLTFKA